MELGIAAEALAEEIAERTFHGRFFRPVPINPEHQLAKVIRRAVDREPDVLDPAVALDLAQLQRRAGGNSTAVAIFVVGVGTGNPKGAELFGAARSPGTWARSGAAVRERESRASVNDRMVRTVVPFCG